MKTIFLIIILALIIGCASKPNITHKEQLILNVPQELLIEPKPLKQL